MPHVVFDIEHSFATITRYVVKSVMEQLMFLTGIDNAEIIYNEPLGYGKNAAANRDPDAPALKLDSKDYFIVTYNERFDEQTIDPLTNFIEHNPVFQHSKLGIYLRPITSKSNIEFNLIYRSKSYNKLAVWLSRFQRNRIVREPHNYHDLIYNYTLPEVVVAYLYDVHALTENVAPYNQTLKDFYKTHYTQGLMSRSNISGTKNALAINVNSKNNLGRYTSLPEDISSDKDKLVHEINFNYTLTYDKVVELLLEYQICIHNQKMDSIYEQFFVRADYPKDSTEGNRTFTGFVNTATEKLDWYKVQPSEIFLDPIDHWLPTSTTPLTSTMLMSLMQVDTNDLTLVEDIHNFPIGKFPQIVKDIMYYFYEYVTTQYAFPFTLELFAIDNVEKKIPITMDINGVVRSTSNLDLRKRHYLRLSLLIDLRRLPLSMLKLLCQNPVWLKDILLMINPSYPVDDLIMLGNGTVVQYESLYKLINDPAYMYNLSNSYGDYLLGYHFSNSLFSLYNESNVMTSQVVVNKIKG